MGRLGGVQTGLRSVEAGLSSPPHLAPPLPGVSDLVVVLDRLVTADDGVLAGLVEVENPRPSLFRSASRACVRSRGVIFAGSVLSRSPPAPLTERALGVATSGEGSAGSLLPFAPPSCLFQCSC